MLDIWSWICQLPESVVSGSLGVLELAKSMPSIDGLTRSIQLKANWMAPEEPDSDDAKVTFSLHMLGFEAEKLKEGTIWVSDPWSLSSDKPFLPLLLQLIREIVLRTPMTQGSTCPRSRLEEVKAEPVVWIMDSHSPESLSKFFDLVFLVRLFWLCCFDMPPEAGTFFFHCLLSPNIEDLACKPSPVLRKFLASVGVDAEVCFTRSLGYMLAKWLILREVGGVGLKTLASPPLADDLERGLVVSYATESHGLWILKGYVPIQAMKVTRSSNQLKSFPVTDPKDSVLKYVLAHQQLEAVIQVEYSVKFFESYIQVNARVDNIRLHVVNLGFKKGDENKEGELADEKHFPSRARLWVGPEVGATYVGGLSLGQSTSNSGKKIETQRVVKGSFGKTKVPKVKATQRTSMRTKTRNWRWDQDADGNAAVFDGVFCDTETGKEVAASVAEIAASGGSGLHKRYAGAHRAFTKAGGVIFAGEECGRSVSWRLSREMEGSVMKWRFGGQVWLTYWPNNSDAIKSRHFETRVVELCDEVDLPLIPAVGNKTTS